jgi:hypothetical protein
VGESGDYSGHKVSRHSRVVSIVDYLFWGECVKAGSVWLSWRLRCDQIKSGGLRCDQVLSGMCLVLEGMCVDHKKVYEGEGSLS